MQRRCRCPANLEVLRSPSDRQEALEFAEFLSECGYSPGALQQLLGGAIHFLFWIGRQQVSPRRPPDLDQALAFERHLAHCRCRWRRARLAGSSGAVRGIRHFLRWCHSQSGAVGVPVANGIQTQAEEVFEKFDQWLAERGVTPLTRRAYQVVLTKLADAVGQDTRRYTVNGIRRFLFASTSRYQKTTAHGTFSKVRTFLRFLSTRGWCQEGLEGSVPRFRSPREAALPRHRPQEDVEQLIDSCKGPQRVVIRDRAVLLLLARLGLRACEVARLQIQDVVWDKAVLRIHGKGGREDLLPLPQEVGESLLAYLEHGRPQSRKGEQAFFLTVKAPFRSLTSPTVVAIVVRAFGRTGLGREGPRGAHVLRHSAATGMLRRGASLQEVSAVLRHRSLATTTIYAKVDTSLLAVVAEVWPEALRC